MLLLLDLEMRVLLELPGNAVGHPEAVDVAKGGAGDDERRPGLVHEDIVHLVDDGEGQFLLALLMPGGVERIAPAGRLHVVAQGSRSQTRCWCRR